MFKCLVEARVIQYGVKSHGLVNQSTGSQTAVPWIWFCRMDFKPSFSEPVAVLLAG